MPISFIQKTKLKLGKQLILVAQGKNVSTR